MDHKYDMLHACGVPQAEVPTAMGCSVNVSFSQERPRSKWLLSVVAMHMTRMVVLVLLTASTILQVSAFPPTLAAALAFCEFFIGWWFQSLRMEAYGFAVGLSVSNVVFAVIVLAGDPSIGLLIGWCLLAAFSCVELSILLLIRFKGYFNYRLMALACSEQNPRSYVNVAMFRMVILAQGLKAFFVLLGFYFVYAISGSLGDPFALMYAIGAGLFGSLDIVAAVGFVKGRDWGFHLVSSMAVLGIVETVLSFSGPVLLLSVWIVTLLMPCWAKNEFLNRVRQAERDMIESPD